MRVRMVRRVRRVRRVRTERFCTRGAGGWCCDRLGDGRCWAHVILVRRTTSNALGSGKAEGSQRQSCHMVNSKSRKVGVGYSQGDCSSNCNKSGSTNF